MLIEYEQRNTLINCMYTLIASGKASPRVRSARERREAFINENGAIDGNYTLLEYEQRNALINYMQL